MVNSNGAVGLLAAPASSATPSPSKLSRKVRKCHHFQSPAAFGPLGPPFVDAALEPLTRLRPTGDSACAAGQQVEKTPCCLSFSNNQRSTHPGGQQGREKVFTAGDPGPQRHNQYRGKGGGEMLNDTFAEVTTHHPPRNHLISRRRPRPDPED